MRDSIHKIIGRPETSAAIAQAAIRDPVKIEREDAGGVRFFDSSERPLGWVTGRHKLAQLLADGSTIALHGSINLVAKPDEEPPHGRVHIRVTLGVPGETYAPFVPKAYRAGIVGESFYQAAIIRCGTGDPVIIWHDVQNPHDPRALAVRTAAGDLIGHISRDSWLQRAVHEDGKGVTASILSMHLAHGMIGVVLSIVLEGEPVQAWPSASPAAALPDVTEKPRKGWLMRLLGL